MTRVGARLSPTVSIRIIEATQRDIMETTLKLRLQLLGNAVRTVGLAMKPKPGSK